MQRKTQVMSIKELPKTNQKANKHKNKQKDVSIKNVDNAGLLAQRHKFGS